MLFGHANLFLGCKAPGSGRGRNGLGSDTSEKAQESLEVHDGWRDGAERSSGVGPRGYLPALEHVDNQMAPTSVVAFCLHPYLAGIHAWDEAEHISGPACFPAVAVVGQTRHRPRAR